MRELNDLIHSLNPNELKSVRNLLISKTENKKSKRVQLFNLIAKNNDLSSEEASQHIYKCKPNSAFSQLKRRLKDDILEMLLICGENYDDKYHQNEQECARMLLQGHQLIYRGLHEQASKILDHVLKIATKYEFWEYCNLANQFKEYSKESTDSILAKYDPKSQVNALNIEEVIMNPEEHLLQSKSKRRDLLQILQCIEKKLSVLTVENLMPVIQHNIEIIRDLPALSKPIYLKAAYQLLAKAHILCGNFDEAIKLLENEYNKIEENTTQTLIELLIIAKLKLMKQEDARELLNIWERRDKNFSSMQKRNYYKACLEFQKGEYKSVIKDLNVCLKKNNVQNNSLSFWSRMLELMTLIEIGEYDWAEYRLEALRKYCFNHEFHELSHITNAYKSIRFLFFSIFQSHASGSYNFSIPKSIIIPNYQPDIFNFEIIDWQGWLKKHFYHTSH